MKKLSTYIARLYKRRGLLLTLLPVVLVTAAIFFPDTALAVAADDTKETTEQSLGYMLALLIQALNTFLWPFLLIIGELMDNDLIVGPGMEDRLLGIWVQVRNLVNIGFVIVLLIIAFYNVLPLAEGEGNLALKTALPKVVLGLILVNFTFIGGKVILDVASVATTAVFALPPIVEGYDFEPQRDTFSQEVCFKSYTDDTTNEKWGVEDKDVPISTQLFCKVEEDAAEYSGELNDLMSATYFEDLNVNNVSLVMAVNMGALEQAALLKPEAIEDFGDLVVNGLFSVIMYLVFATTYVVLGLVLLTRIVVLWVALALSPVAVLFWVVPQLKEAIGGGAGDVVTKVTKSLLAPIIIGVTMTIGFLMIAALGDLGSAFTEFADVNTDEFFQAEFLVSGIHDMEKFIIAIASVVIVWTGVFAAAEGTAAEFATGAIKGFGERIAKAAATAPLLATTVPIARKEGEVVKASPLALMGLAEAGLNRIEYAGGEGARGLARKLGVSETFYGTRTGAGRSPEANARDIVEALAKDTISEAQLREIANKMYYTVQSGTLKGDNKEQVRKTLLDISRGTVVGEEGLKGLREIVRKQTAQELGLGTYYTEIEQRLALGTVTVAEAPAREEGEGAEEGEGEPGTPPAPTATTVNIGGTDVDISKEAANTINNLVADKSLVVGNLTRSNLRTSIPNLTPKDYAAIEAALPEEPPEEPETP